MPALSEIPVARIAPDRFRAVLGEGFAEMEPEIARARERLRERVVWHVNSTGRGGGVAEMLRSHLAYVRGAGIDVRWVVIEGEPRFYEVTKRIHNRLHEDRGDGGELGGEEREAYERTLARASGELTALAQPGDVVFLHDPQTAGLVPSMRGAVTAVVWRCHVGVDSPGELARSAWEFLVPYVEAADAWVFSRPQFVWEGLDERRTWIVPPTIDAFSAKNQDLDPAAVGAILGVIGLADAADGAPAFERGDGTPARVNRAARIVQRETLPREAAVVAQVSRWDRLKDPIGVLRCFERLGDAAAHLVLAGPDVEAVTDDPEGAQVWAEVRRARDGMEPGSRRRVHLVSLPMDDLEENAAMVNAIQRRATVVVQKSIAEGFGLTVAEAMWKAKPVVASKVGGIQDQIVDGESGFLVEDPTDLAAVAGAIDRPLTDARLASRVGAAARERVRMNFLAIGVMLGYFRRLEVLIDGA